MKLDENRKDKFSRMVANARKADIDAIRELKGYIYEASGIANKSLRALEKAGITEYAYGRAMTFLNTEYQSVKFPQAVAKRPVEDLIKQAYQLHAFLASKTRTVRGAREARRKQIEGIKTLQLLGYNIPTDASRLKRISRILGNDGLRFTGTIRYELMEAIDATHDSTLTDEEVQIMINRYYSGEISYDKVLEDLYNA